MTDKVQKIREEVERLKESGCASHIVICDTLLAFIDSLQEEPVKILVKGDIIARYIGSTELQVEYLMQSGDYAESYDERNFDVVIDGDLHIDYLHLLTDKVRICATGRISATR